MTSKPIEEMYPEVVMEQPSKKKLPSTKWATYQGYWDILLGSASSYRNLVNAINEAIQEETMTAEEGLARLAQHPFESRVNEWLARGDVDEDTLRSMINDAFYTQQTQFLETALEAQKEKPKEAPAQRTAWVRTPQPRPTQVEYGPALEEMRTGFGIPKTETWRDWFRSKYPRLIEQYEGQVSEMERAEKGWREWLAGRKPEIREEWWKLTPYQRGERPAAHAPRIQTVRF